jgi:hypothetical protein
MGAFSPDGRIVATGSDDQIVRLWDPESGLPASEPLAHSGPVGRLSFSPDGKRLLTFGGRPKFWDVLVAPTPVPEWFCELIDAVAGFRLTPMARCSRYPRISFLSCWTELPPERGGISTRAGRNGFWWTGCRIRRRRSRWTQRVIRDQAGWRWKL